MASITYLGHSGFKILLGNRILFIDIFTGDNIRGQKRLVPNILDPNSVKEADLIFVTHEHAAHCDAEAIKRICERTLASVVAPKPALAMLEISERLKVDVRVGDKFTIKDIDVEVLKAVHPQSAYPVGYIIRGEGKSIYHAGDTYAFSEMRGIRVDLALLPIGGAYTMDPISAHSVCKEMRPKYAIPMHYNTYERISQDPKEFTEDLGPTRGIALKVGQTMNF